MARYINVEIDNARLRIAEIEDNGRKPRMLMAFGVAVPQGVIDDGEIRDTKNLGELLAQTLNSHGVRTKKAYFVASSSRIASRRLQIPLVKKNKIQALLEENVTEYFPIDATKYVLSYMVLGEIEKPAEGNTPAMKQYDLLAYAAPKTISTAYQEMAEYAGLTLTGIGYTGESIYQSVRDLYSEGVHLVAKIEMDHTLISVIKDGDLALQRSVNYGLDSAVDAVLNTKAFGDISEEGEALAVLYSQPCLYGRLEAEALDADPVLSEARMEVTESFRYLIGNISRIMDYYISRNPGAVFDSVACCGLGGGILGLPALFGYELAQPVTILDTLGDAPMPKLPDGDGLYLFIALASGAASGVNLMEKVTKKQKNEKDSMRGAILICGLGIAAGLLLAIIGLGARGYQQFTHSSLERKIASKQSIQELYDTYTQKKELAESFDSLYAYTSTPNEQLRAFLEEMEEKMPADLTLDSFTSTGTEVDFNLHVSDKNEAAQVLMQLRTFESLATVTTAGLDEDENGDVTMLVNCTYATPAAVSDSAQ